MGDPLDAVQQDLFDNITDKLVEYLDPRRNFWRLGWGVGYEFDRRKKVTLVVVRPVLKSKKKRAVKLPLSSVRLHAIQNKTSV
jgi:hypothetical protein